MLAVFTGSPAQPNDSYRMNVFFSVDLVNEIPGCRPPEVGEGETYLRYTVTARICGTMGSDKSQFYVGLVVRGKVTRQCL